MVSTFLPMKGMLLTSHGTLLSFRKDQVSNVGHHFGFFFGPIPSVCQQLSVALPVELTSFPHTRGSLSRHSFILTVCQGPFHVLHKYELASST